ncbi:MAG: sigma-70 family RNA polymerase sigma factor [Nitrospiraceae bacterium]|nr:sigma-70 family RNA polymerase sigma factor [Nitrospiraceae bacterium]
MPENKRSRKKTVWGLVEEARSLSLDPTTAIGELIGKYENRIRTLAKLALSKGMNEGLDELMQRGVLGLLLAINGFDRRRGAAFYTYASQCIKGLMLKRDWLSGRGVSLDSSDGDDEEPLYNVIPSNHPDPFKAAEIGEMWKLSERLPRSQRIVLVLRYREGLTLQEAGARMGGISKEAVRQFEEKAIANMKKLINGT